MNRKTPVRTRHAPQEKTIRSRERAAVLRDEAQLMDQALECAGQAVADYLKAHDEDGDFSTDWTAEHGREWCLDDLSDREGFSVEDVLAYARSYQDRIEVTCSCDYPVAEPMDRSDPAHNCMCPCHPEAEQGSQIFMNVPFPSAV